MDSSRGKGRDVTRRTVVVLAGLLLFQSLVVSGVFTPRPHTGGDNAGYVSLAHSILDRGQYRELWDPAEPPHTKYPPVFPVLLAAAILLGAKTWATLKLVPAFSVVLAVAFSFLWVRERRGILFAAAVAVLFGLSESVVYYSQWILSEPTFLALTFAALWALEKAARGDGREGSDSNERTTGLGRWMAVGLLLVGVAYFTRSAGLPLAAAALLWLALRRRWRALVAFGILFGVPALLWYLRGSVLGGSEYVAEFWLVDPYRPDLGRIGVLGLLGRLQENFVAYVTVIIPGGIVGDGRAFLPPVGIGFGLVTLVGWVKSLREKPGPAEFLLPLYLGLILLWPPAWSGDRFALPLLPVMFFYSGVGLVWLMGSFPRRAQIVAMAALVVAVLIPAGLEWNRMMGDAESCRDASLAGTPTACLPPAQAEYFALAEWSGRNLPDDAVVTTRKPRTFFLMSGVKARSIPMVADRGEFLRRARANGGRYVSLDLLDTVAGYYVYPAVLERHDAFCGMVEVGEELGGGTQLLGLLPPDTEPPAEGGEARILSRCPPTMFLEAPRDRPEVTGWEIPLLLW
jgi:hypothetical protein